MIEDQTHPIKGATLRSKERTKTKLVLNSFLYGSASSGVSILLYQPLDLVKTRLQLPSDNQARQKIFGKSINLIANLIKEHGIYSLWRGTAASLLRSIPGVGLYYAFLEVLQQNYSSLENKPDNPTQAFLFGLTARSTVSLALMPITVTKVHYECDKIERNTNIFRAVKEVYSRYGWLGSAPTVLRDSLFSGAYYMSYTKFKYFHLVICDRQLDLKYNFLYGILSGVLASVLTNPFDVIKTRIQVGSESNKSMSQVARNIQVLKRYQDFFQGLGLRVLRRTLVAASTWTIYEHLMQNS